MVFQHVYKIIDDEALNACDVSTEFFGLKANQPSKLCLLNKITKVY